jgi:hypothetical protein
MMRKITSLGLWGSLLLLLPYCTKPTPEMSAAEVQALIQEINLSPMGVTIAVEDASIATGSYEGRSDTVLITLTDPAFFVSTKIFKHMQLEVPEFELPLKMGKLSWTYRPAEKKLGVLSVEGLSFAFDTSKFVQIGESWEGHKVPALELSYHLESISFGDFDITPLLHAQEQTFAQTLTGLAGANQKKSISLDGFTLDFDAQDGAQHMKWTLGHAEERWTLSPEMLGIFFQKGEAISTFKRLLEEGKDLLNLEAMVKDIDVFLRGPWGDIDANLSSLNVSYSLAPEKDREAFHLSFGYDLGKLAVTGAQQKAWQTWMDVSRLNLRVSLGRISPDFLAAYFDFMRSSQALRGSHEPAKQQEMAMQGLALLGKFIKTKPVISLSLSPFDHALGIIQAEGKFQFLQMGPPVGKATVSISNILEIEEKLRAGELLPPDETKQFVEILKDIFVLDENGEGTLTFEIKEGDPSNFYLNGEPKSFRLQK